jgi:hypothetical protein
VVLLEQGKTAYLVEFNDFGNDNDGIAQQREACLENERINFDEPEHMSPHPFCRMNNFNG